MVKKKRKNNTKPTLKQRRAAKNTVENGGSVSKGMRDAGYSAATAKNPNKVTDSNNWQELMQEYLPDDLLAKKHNELLTVPRKIRTFSKGELETETEEVDSTAISKGLDMAYKLKGKFVPTEIKFIDDNDDISDEELAKQIASRQKKS